MKALYMSLSMLPGMAKEEVVEAIEASGADAMQEAIKTIALDEAVEANVIDAEETTNLNQVAVEKTDKTVLIMVVLKPVAVIIVVQPARAKRPVEIARMLVFTDILPAKVEAVGLAVKILAEADVRILDMAAEDTRITTKTVPATQATDHRIIDADFTEGENYI